MGLLVDQYQENGSNIVQNLARKSEVKKSYITKEIQKKKTEMLSVYSEAGAFVEGTVSELMENSMSQV